MIRKISLFLITMLGLSGVGSSATPESAGLCQQAILSVEQQQQIPKRLLASISIVESGRRDPRGSQLVAWPWTINAQGQGYFFDTEEEAIAAVRSFQAQGIDSIDVGCMQINLRQHADAFQSLEEAFDPMSNARYGAHFLADLFSRLHGWPAAIGAYHSMTPALGSDYARHVLTVWMNNTGTEPPLSSHFVTVPHNASVVRPFAPSMITYAPPPRIIRHDNDGTVPGGGGVQTMHGRSLSSYRLAPVRLAWKR